MAPPSEMAPAPPSWFTALTRKGLTVGVLRIITETGMFHSAAKITVAGASTWYGFKPKTHRAMAGAGFVDTSDRSTFERSWATWTIDDTRLAAAAAKAQAAYRDSFYAVGFQDCVSFTAYLCRAAGMDVPDVNMTPAGFLTVLTLKNPPTGQGRTSQDW